jgi:hypothetical protein
MGHLRTINLSHNRLDAAHALLLGVGHNSSLTALNLSHNLLRAQSVSKLPAMCARNVTLKELDLSFNQLSNRAAPLLLLALSRSRSLDEIQISDNFLTDDFKESVSAAAAMTPEQRRDKKYQMEVRRRLKDWRERARADDVAAAQAEVSARDDNLRGGWGGGVHFEKGTGWAGYILLASICCSFFNFYNF